MTAICLKAKSAVKTDTWLSVFKGLNTDSKSCVFIKQLTSTCISTILYMRKVFPDDFFESKSFEGITLKLLKNLKGESHTLKIQQWLEGAFEAIDKKYLKRLMLDIQDAESNMTLEIYTMTFNFNKDQEDPNPRSTTTDKFTTTTTEIHTIKLLQMCYAITETYSSLPSQVKLSIRLSYHENTPEDYQPEGYMAWSAVDPEFPKPARSIEIGKTNTDHHFFRLVNKSCLNENFFKGMESQKQKNDSVSDQNNTGESRNLLSQKFLKAKRELNFDTANNEIPGGDKNVSEIKKKFIVTEKCVSRVNTNKQIQDLNNQEIRCACLSSDRSEKMFSCLSCKYRVHAECFGILSFDPNKKIRFYCHICHHPGKNLKCHDKILLSLPTYTDQQKLSLLRKALCYCYAPTVTTVTLKKIEKIAGKKCSKNVVNAVFNKLLEIGIAIPQGIKKRHLINKNVLHNKMNNYFYKVQNQTQASSPYSLRNPRNKFNSIQQSKKIVQVSKICNFQDSQQSCDIFTE